jgi:hypothetical protein
MKWKNQWSGEWIRHFALFPENVEGETVWLQFYWERYTNINDGEGCACGSHVVGKYDRTLNGIWTK